jgi:alpha-tubulin suppressor-like RCC1 family protein
MGFAEVGQLGNGKVAEQVFQWPQLLPSLDQANIQSLAVGLDHTIALGANGDVYTWGFGGSGQLGNGLSDEAIVAIPTKVEDLPSIAKIFAGSDHSGGVDRTK